MTDEPVSLTVQLMDHCKTCHQEFLGVEDRTYCSKHCRDVGEAAYGKTRLECLFCGKPYTVKNAHNRFCCAKHADLEKQNKPRPYRRCKICKRPFRPHNYRQRFCSTRCRNIFHNPRKTPLLKHCSICGSPFMPYRPNQICCSDRCSTIRRKATDRIRYNTNRPSELKIAHTLL